jgi:UDP-N-acetylmuramyl pentapeptide synthase
VLGDMLELGPEAEDLHGEIGRQIALSGIDEVLAVGDLSRAIGREAARAGFKAVTSLATAAEAADHLLALVRPGDVILVKASRGVGLDRVVTALRERLGEDEGGEGRA